MSNTEQLSKKRWEEHYQPQAVNRFWHEMKRAGVPLDYLRNARKNTIEGVDQFKDVVGFYKSPTEINGRHMHSIYAFGPHGHGKSHAVTVAFFHCCWGRVLHYYRKMHKSEMAGKSVSPANFQFIWRTMNDLVDELYATDSLAEQTRCLNRFKKAEVLMVDDIGSQQRREEKDFRKEVIYKITEARKNQELPTLYTSNYSAAEFAKVYTPQAADRLLERYIITEIDGIRYRNSKPAGASGNPGALRKVG